MAKTNKAEKEVKEIKEQLEQQKKELEQAKAGLKENDDMIIKTKKKKAAGEDTGKDIREMQNKRDNFKQDIEDYKKVIEELKADLQQAKEKVEQAEKKQLEKKFNDLAATRKKLNNEIQAKIKDLAGLLRNLKSIDKEQKGLGKQLDFNLPYNRQYYVIVQDYLSLELNDLDLPRPTRRQQLMDNSISELDSLAAE